MLGTALGSACVLHYQFPSSAPPVFVGRAFLLAMTICILVRHLLKKSPPDLDRWVRQPALWWRRAGQRGRKQLHDDVAVVPARWSPVKICAHEQTWLCTKKTTLLTAARAPSARSTLRRPRPRATRMQRRAFLFLSCMRRDFRKRRSNSTVRRNAPQRVAPPFLLCEHYRILVS